MIQQDSPKELSLADYIPRTASIFAVVTGCAVLIGWEFDIPVLMSLIPGFVTMKPLTAFVFILSGASLWFLINSSTKFTKRIGQLFAAVITFISLLTIAEYIFKWNLWIDYFLFYDKVIAEGIEFPGRLSPATALSIFLLGISLLSSDIETKNSSRPSKWLALVVALISLLALIGYTYNVQAINKINYFIILSLPSAIAFFVVSIGVLFVNGNRGITDIVLKNSLGGGIARRLLPIAVLIPFVIGWLTLKGEESDYYDPRFGIAIFAMANILMFTLVIWWAVRSLDQTDAKRKLSEKQLTESDQDFRALVTATSQAIWESGANGKSSEIERWQKDIKGKIIDDTSNWLESVHPEDREKASSDWNHAFENKVLFDTEYRIKNVEGDYQYFAVRGVPVFDESGTLRKWIGTYTDISERKNAEQKLRLSEERYRHLFENNPCSMWVYDAETLKYLAVNKAAIFNYGYSQEEFLSMTIKDIRPPEDIPKLVKEISDNEGKLKNAGVWRHIKKDGSIIYAEINSHEIMFDGRLARLVLANDITERQLAGEALKNSEHRFRALIEHSSDGIALIDKNNEILYLSPSVKSIEGYEPEELIWRNGVENTHPDDLPVISGIVEKLLNKPGKPIPVEWRRRHKKGHWLWLEGVATNLLNDPAIGAIVTNYRDITNRKKAEEDLIKSEKRFRNTLDKMLEGVQIINFDWKYIYVNDAFTKQGKYKKKELIGYTVMEKYPGIEETEVYQAYQKCFNERVPIHMENKFAFPDNTVGWFELSFQPIPEGIFILSVDITERKQAEEELRSEKDRLNKTAMASPIAIFSFCLSPDGEVKLPYSSPKIYDVLGLTPEELKKNAAPAFERVHPADLPQVNESIAESARDMTLLYVTYRYQHPHKGEIWVECFGSPVSEPDGSVTWHGVANDITKRKGQEEEIRQLNENLEQKVIERTAELNVVNKELEAFSYSVSHDLRAPLRGIDGFSLALLEDYEDVLDEEGKYFLHRIRAGSQQMAQLIDDMLKLSRVTRTEMVKDEVNLSEIVKAIAKRLQEINPRDNVTFDIKENVCAIGDERLLRIALENLLENSYKFTSKCEEAKIIFGQQQNGTEPVYFVRDNGVGFDMTYADKLFGAFQRFHSGKDFEGTGIGLATVQRVISRHGGRIYAESKVGEGASFYFTIR